MPIPSRPVTMTGISSDWGQQIHDYTFAPAGCRVTGGSVEAASGTAWATLPIDTPSDDPGGYADLVNNRLEIPDDGAGLYTVNARLSSDEGDADDFAQFRIRVNGAEVLRSPVEQQAGSTAVSTFISGALQLDVGDQLDVQGRQLGGGTRADLAITQLLIVRIGSELGAPS